MSFDLALDRPDHNLYFEQLPHITGAVDIRRYSIKAIDGADKVAQQIKMTLLTFLGEWFLDVTFGVPYLEEILIKNPKLTSVENILRTKIKDVPDVERIVEFGMDYDRARRTLSVAYIAETLLGPIKDSIKLDLNQRLRSYV